MISVLDCACEWLLIPDVRFKNEFEYIRSKGGILLRVERPNVEWNQHGVYEITNNHESETELDDCKEFDHIIKNDSNLLALEIVVKQLKLV